MTVNPDPTTITETRLRRDLTALGIEPGMILIVHASLKSIGWVIGGAPTVVRALLGAIGDEGTLAMTAATPHGADPETWAPDGMALMNDSGSGSRRRNETSSAVPRRRTSISRGRSSAASARAGAATRATATSSSAQKLARFSPGGVRFTVLFEAVMAQ